jgi:hypothetical protein
MRFQKLVINAGVEYFINWILKRFEYKPVLLPINSHFYIVEAKHVNSHYPYLLFVAKDGDKIDVDPHDLFQLIDINSKNEDTSTEKGTSTEELKKGTEVPEVIEEDQFSKSVLTDEELWGNNEIRKIIEDEFFLKDITLLQIFLISLDVSKTEAYCVIYDEIIDDVIKSLIDEIDSLVGIIKNEPIGSTNWYQNYAFFPMLPIEQGELTDEDIIAQVFPRKKKVRSKGKKGLTKPYNIPPNIYSNEITKYEWLSDYDFMKGYYDKCSLWTMELIIRNFQFGYENYQKNGGEWGPKQISDLLNLSATYVGRYIKALRKLGVVSIDEIPLPKKSPNQE